MSPADAADPTAAVHGGESTPASGDGLDLLRRFGKQRIWPADATLLRQGERPPLLFVIASGEVAVRDESRRDERRLVQIVHAGASIGDLAVLLGKPCPYTAVARVKTATLGFSRETVHDLLALDPQICFLWLHLLSGRIAGGYPRSTAVAGRSAVDRVGRFILDEARANGGSSVTLTQAELASVTGLSRQRVSSVLGSLERLGAVERGRGCVRITDAERLRAMLPR